VLEDRIVNKSNEKLAADWGYHIQLRPAEGAKYLVPSKYMRDYGGAEIKSNSEIWYASAEPGERKQVLTVHKNLEVSKGILGDIDSVKTLLKYPDGYGIMTVIPPTPWIGSWFSSGGKGGKEWCFETSEDNKPIPIMENYDGVGSEFGQGDLGDGNDEEGQYRNSVLEPGKSIDMMMIFELLQPENAEKLEQEIREYINNL